ncbi:hypothetical protein AMAG_04592 [Allomyces macrogynus ATCC 38327]|uniref:PNPLA domain-containing protein n=1 Tax=Allomyces macrogynus (strain ATCC 38327) TaxID=578462 RepID=A0A0L0S5U1_ALLM3|nr:hypothetical protein AMAG_04592 [Allomyces macrogynus ATCC 38327]|eukprot:KNE57734.1 hypothetical protein AMAG_04592 [Allomyces macrogynus ATCC 38327]
MAPRTAISPTVPLASTTALQAGLDRRRTLTTGTISPDDMSGSASDDPTCHPLNDPPLVDVTDPILAQGDEAVEDWAAEYGDLYGSDSDDMAGTPPALRRAWMRNKPSGWGYTILRWPLLILIGLILAVELLLYTLVRYSVVIYEHVFFWRGERGALRSRLKAATTYTEWTDAATALEEHFGRTQWRHVAASPDYNYTLIASVVAQLRRYRADPAKLRDVLLESACKSDLGGVENVRLYSQSYVGTKRLVHEYIDETVDAIENLATGDAAPWATPRAKRTFFRQAAQLYGRSALCLSGGASCGYYHLGVIRALLDAKLLPRVITGTSAGSLIAAFVGTRTDAELDAQLNVDLWSKLTACDEPWTTRLHRLWREGHLFSRDRWQEKMQWVTHGDMTFAEAYAKTGRALNITVVAAGASAHAPPKLLNHLTSPNVVIWSAVLASSAVPGVIEPVQLMIKKRDDVSGKEAVLPFVGWGEYWQDGSLRIDIPTKSLHQLFNVNYVIVSQVNPHVSVFFFENRGGSGHPTAHRGGLGWRGGFLASTAEHVLKLELKKWLKVIRDLRLLPRMLNQDWSFLWLQKFDGNVTILPKATPYDIVHILDDPTEDRMRWYLLKGQRVTWSRLAMIRNRLRIEQTLERVRMQLATEARAARARARAQRLSLPFVDDATVVADDDAEDADASE